MTKLIFIPLALLLLSACDFDKNHSLCGQMGLCGKEEPDPMCEHYGTCAKEDGDGEGDEKVDN